MLSCPEVTVRDRLRQAKQQLQQAIQDLEAGADRNAEEFPALGSGPVFPVLEPRGHAPSQFAWGRAFGPARRSTVFAPRGAHSIFTDSQIFSAHARVAGKLGIGLSSGLPVPVRWMTVQRTILSPERWIASTLKN